MNGGHDLTQVVERAKSILCALGFSAADRYSKVPLSPAKTDAKNNVRIVDKGDEFPHYTEDERALQ
jgi:hypothetical protein